MKWKAPRAATTTDTGSQPTRVSRRGGHLVIDGLTAQMHGGLPTSVLPTSPCPGQTTLRSPPDSKPTRYFIPVVCPGLAVCAGRGSLRASASGERAARRAAGRLARRRGRWRADRREARLQPAKPACAIWSLPVGRAVGGRRRGVVGVQLEAAGPGASPQGCGGRRASVASARRRIPGRRAYAATGVCSTAAGDCCSRRWSSMRRAILSIVSA